MSSTTARRLAIHIEVDDDGGPDDYDQIVEALQSIGAEIVAEVEL